VVGLPGSDVIRRGGTWGVWDNPADQHRIRLQIRAHVGLEVKIAILTESWYHVRA
jgi:hypothetical protein